MFNTVPLMQNLLFQSWIDVKCSQVLSPEVFWTNWTSCRCPLSFGGYSLHGNGRKFRGCLPICFALAGFFSVARGWWIWAREREREREREQRAWEKECALIWQSFVGVWPSSIIRENIKNITCCFALLSCCSWGGKIQHDTQLF